MLPLAAKTQLITGANDIFADVCALRQGHMKHAPQIETDFTGSFIENGVPALDAEFRKVLGRHNVSVVTRAVYIHQSPMVAISGTPPRPMKTTNCELGDVLIVHSHKRNRWKTYWRAALWQLKIDRASRQKAEDPQYWLYERWPFFKVYRGGLKSGKRDFLADNRSGCYALVSNSGWLICPPIAVIGPKAASVVDAGRFVVEMMYAVDPAQTGRNEDRGRRVFTRPNESPPLNWSQTVWELLNITGAKDFSARTLYDSRRSRLSLMVTSNLADINLMSDGNPPTGAAGEDSRGLAVVHFATDATECDPSDEPQI
jgi:hypothetical protein